MDVLAIDPSIRACGVCAIQGTKIHLTTLRPTPDGELVSRLDDLRSLLGTWLICTTTQGFDTAVIEYPTFQDSDRGRIAAVGGHTLKLATVCGYLAHALVSTVETDVEFVTPTRWKGRMNKDDTLRLILQHPKWGPQLRKLKFDNNAADAAGIAIWRHELRAQKRISYEDAEEIEG